MVRRCLHLHSNIIIDYIGIGIYALNNQTTGNGQIGNALLGLSQQVKIMGLGCGIAAFCQHTAVKLVGILGRSNSQILATGHPHLKGANISIICRLYRDILGILNSPTVLRSIFIYRGVI